MDERAEELIESLEALLVDLSTMGYHFVVVLTDPSVAALHHWRTRNPIVNYGLTEIVASQIHEELTQGSEQE